MLSKYILKTFIINTKIYLDYNKYINIKTLKEQKELYNIYKALEHLKAQNLDIPAHTVGDLAIFTYTQFPHLGKQQDVYDKLFEQLERTEVDESRIVEYLNEVRVQSIATEVAEAALAVADGHASFDKVHDLVKLVDQDLKPNESPFVEANLEHIYRRVRAENGLRWRLNTLNRMLGSLRPGNFGFVFARPERGKTTFLASEVTFMASQTDRPVLWVNNEQDGAAVLQRCYQAALGCTDRELFANLEANQQRYQEITRGNICLYDNAGVSKKDVDRLCEEFKPSLIVLDQIDKVYGFEADRYDLKMKAIYQWARELSKRYGPTIGICQAGGTADNKKWLTYNDVDSSHTAKQGEADFILGIGAVDDVGSENVRYFHLSKNKLPGDEDTLPALRHGKAEVWFRPEIARYEDKVKL